MVPPDELKLFAVYAQAPDELILQPDELTWAPDGLKSPAGWAQLHAGRAQSTAGQAQAPRDELFGLSLFGVWTRRISSVSKNIVFL